MAVNLPKIPSKPNFSPYCGSTRPNAHLTMTFSKNYNSQCVRTAPFFNGNQNNARANPNPNPNQTDCKKENFSQAGTNVNTGPHYQKLFTRVTHICGNCKGQPDRSAMKGPHLERTASLITVPPA